MEQYSLLNESSVNKHERMFLGCLNISQLKLYNVILMGLSFMFLFTAYNTTQNFLTNILLTEGFGNLGFYSLSILYAGVVLTVFTAPILVEKLGERLSMFLGAFCYWYKSQTTKNQKKCIAAKLAIFKQHFKLFIRYSLYMGSLIYVIPYVIYASSAVLGFGAAILWVAQGSFISICSSDSTRGLNNGFDNS